MTQIIVGSFHVAENVIAIFFTKIVSIVFWDFAL